MEAKKSRHENRRADFAALDEKGEEGRPGEFGQDQGFGDPITLSPYGNATDRERRPNEQALLVGLQVGLAAVVIVMMLVVHRAIAAQPATRPSLSPAKEPMP